MNPHGRALRGQQDRHGLFIHSECVLLNIERKQLDGVEGALAGVQRSLGPRSVDHQIGEDMNRRLVPSFQYLTVRMERSTALSRIMLAESPQREP